MGYTFASATILLLLITDPFGNIPIFANALKNVPPERRPMVILREVLIAFALLLLFMFIGEGFLRLMNLSALSLQIAGGVILFLIALRMIFPAPLPPEDALTPISEPLIVPLAVPALAGPSALATVLLFSSHEMRDVMVHVAALTAVAAVWLGVFLSAERLQRALGPQVMTAFERLMGLILTAMAVEMLLAGIRAFLKSL